MSENQFLITNVLNHNTVICLSKKDKQRYMFFGKGIGFKRKEKEIFKTNNQVEHLMMVLDDNQVNEYKKLLEKVKDEKLISIVQKVVYQANKYFENKVNSRIYYTLLDHLNFALEREKQNIKITYPFINELQYIYPKEYEFSKKALKYINENLDKPFPQSELGFITLHIHAGITDSKVSTVVLINQICHECVEIIEKEKKTKVNIESTNFIRFKHHLESAIYRSKKDIKLENVILDVICQKCKIEFEIAKKVAELLNRKYHISLNDNELGYLALHIYNLK